MAALAVFSLAASGSAAFAANGFGEAFADLGAPAAVAAAAGAVDVSAIAGEAVEDAETEATEIGAEITGGLASWYGNELAGRRTASGETFDPSELTAAHRTLPFGSKVRVTFAPTGRSVVVRITDRGPFHGGRVIDLSRAAAERIGLRAAGSGRVTLALIEG